MKETILRTTPRPLLAALWLAAQLPVEASMFYEHSFSAFRPGARVSVDFSSPAVGHLKSGSARKLEPKSGPLNFVAQIEATVPEPSGLALWALGGCGLLMATNRFRRKR
jgi:hypothetical protein